MLPRVANFTRFFIGVFFLLGAAFNLVMTFIDAGSYKNGGVTAWPPFLQDFWNSVVAPNIVVFLLLFILIEITLGLLILNKGGRVKIGLGGAFFFSVALLFLGLGYPQDAWVPRIPNIAFAVICLLLLLGRYERTFLETVRRRKIEIRTKVIGG
jgi:hypothetical protein